MGDVECGVGLGLHGGDRSVVAPPCQTLAMNGVAHPFAGAGGGTLFEYKVAALFAADLIRSRHTELGGLVAAFEMQTGPRGFDDLKISVELLGGGDRTVFAQCRFRQPFTESDRKFRELISKAVEVVLEDETSFATGGKRLAIVVDSSSPGHASMTRVCELARDPGDFDRFIGVLESHAGGVLGRWGHCLGAAGDRDPELVRRVLSAIEVRALDLRNETSKDSVELLNRLADAWAPRDFASATNLGDAVFRLLADVGPAQGSIDLSWLQLQLRSQMPPTLGADTRRERLCRLRDSGHLRVASAMKAIGLNDEGAEMLATRALSMPPRITSSAALMVVVGGKGVGKTTELERIHGAAVDRAIDNPHAPIPVLVHARQVGDSPLKAIASGHVEGLGDPSLVGVHMVVDGLDEAGVRVSDLSSRIATLQGEWPNSTVIMGTRPQHLPPGIEAHEVALLSQEAATNLMSCIHPDIGRMPWLREELAEVLRLPFFAIRYALDIRDGNYEGMDLGQLVGSVGRQALDDMGDRAGEVFDALVRLACLIVESGGRPADVRNLGASQPQVAQLMRSRIVQAVDGHASFQLAALTEWFAAQALLRDPSQLAHSVSSPMRAHRWRYVFVQALLQGSAEQIDNVMSTLLSNVPATAAWVQREAASPFGGSRSAPLAASVEEAGARIRRAAESWTAPWPGLLERWGEVEELPTLGIAIEDKHLTTAWTSGNDDNSKPVVPLPPGLDPFGATNFQWARWMQVVLGSGETWPWDWARAHFEQTVDRHVESLELLADIDLCWPELAWDFANRMLGRYSATESAPVQRADLESTIAHYRNISAGGEVIVSSGDWRLTEGEAFVADLVRLGISEVESPWPAANTVGTATWSCWTTEQLLDRLQQATKTALDVYREIVELHMPSMAPELNTYQLLPARFVGQLVPADSDRGFEGAPRYRWHIEPLPNGSANEADWSVVETLGQVSDTDWELRKAKLEAMRGDFVERATLSTHMGEPEILCSTPAGFLALRLLQDDLSEFEWTTGLHSQHWSLPGTRPRYT